MNRITPADLHYFTQKHRLALLYFQGEDCTVCRALAPKIAAIAAEEAVPLLTIDMPTNPHLAATEMVLSVPVVKLFVAGREVWKAGAYLQPAQLQKRILDYKAMPSDAGL